MSIMRASYWVDSNGKTRLVTQEANATLASLELALQAKSNASIFKDFEGTRVNSLPVPTAAQYPSVFDVALLTYTDATGDLVNVLLPAPVSAMFLSDGETVDTTQLTAINLAVIGTVLTPGGGVVTAYVSGTRIPSRGSVQ